MDNRFTLHTANNLDVLPTLPDNSVDAIVCDPPYELTDKSIRQKFLDVFNRSFNIVFPNFDQTNSNILKYGDFVGKFIDGSLLRNAQILDVIKPWVGVPESAIDFNDNVFVGDEKVGANAELSANLVSNCILMDELDTKFGQDIGNYILDFGDSFDLAIGNLANHSLGHLSSGLFSMPIGSILSAINPNILVNDSLSFSANGIDNIVGLTNNPASQTQTTPFILTSSGAENGLMLRFNMAGGSTKFNATIGAINFDDFRQFACPKLVRTIAPASILSSMLEPVKVYFISSSTNRTSSINYFHIWLPKNLLTNIGKITHNSKGFMGKKWDSTGIAYNVELWRECLRVLKPGGHLLAFSSTRTYHRMACAIEDAGFEIRTQLIWLFSQSMPKGQNISKALEGVIGTQSQGFKTAGDDNRKSELKQNLQFRSDYGYKFEPATDAAKQWDGWNTGLSPSHEPICLARKPISEATIVANVLRWGVGGLNIKATRIPTVGRPLRENVLDSKGSQTRSSYDLGTSKAAGETNEGRYPKTVLIDDSDEVREIFPETGKSKKSQRGAGGLAGIYGEAVYESTERGYNDEGGSAARYFASFEFDDDDQPLPVGFYCGKVKPSERNAGLEGFELKEAGVLKGRADGSLGGEIPLSKNIHPTLKPIKLMRWLCRLITPPNGTVLDPFMGSGSTGMAAMREGFKFIGIEMDTEYAEIARARIQYAIANPTDKKVTKSKPLEPPFVFPDDLDLINPQPPKPTQQKLF